MSILRHAKGENKNYNLTLFGLSYRQTAKKRKKKKLTQEFLRKNNEYYCKKYFYFILSHFGLLFPGRKSKD